MDKRVAQAMQQWPDVPAARGWLRLTRRGQWLLRNEPIGNANLLAFINRNYGTDDSGEWFFQNGPQRVIVSLDYTPWVYHQIATEAVTLQTHNNLPVKTVRSAFVDEQGALLLQTEYGIGVVDDRDMDGLLPCFVSDQPLDAIETLMAGEPASPSATLGFRYNEVTVTVASIRSGEVPNRFGYELNC